jgi:hypothetical protein
LIARVFHAIRRTARSDAATILSRLDTIRLELLRELHDDPIGQRAMMPHLAQRFAIVNALAPPVSSRS